MNMLWRNTGKAGSKILVAVILTGFIGIEALEAQVHCAYKTESAECFKQTVVAPEMTKSAIVRGMAEDKVKSLARSIPDRVDAKITPLAPYAGGNNDYRRAHEIDYLLTIAPRLISELAIPDSEFEPVPGLGNCMSYHSNAELCVYFHGCHPLIRFTAASHYRYPVDKVESSRIPFNTRYVDKDTVKGAKELTSSAMPDPMNDPRPLEVTLGQRTWDAAMRALKTPPPDIPPAGPTANPDLVATITSYPIDQRQTGNFDRDMRYNEFHAVPEIVSRKKYPELRRDYKKKVWAYECTCSITGTDCGVTKVELPSLCHNNKPAPELPFEYTWGSEFPGPMGGYAQTRLPWWINKDNKLKKYRNALARIRNQANYCSMMDRVRMTELDGETWGFVPPEPSGGISALTEAIPEDKRDGLHPESEIIENPCLRNGLGPYIPFRNIAKSLFGTVAAELGFIQGEELSYSYKKSIFYSWQPSRRDHDDDNKDIYGDKVQWISIDSRPGARNLKMPEGCVIAELPFDQFDKEANLELPDDFPKTGVQWREFECCLEGDPVGWEENKG